MASREVLEPRVSIRRQVVRTVDWADPGLVEVIQGAGYRVRSKEVLGKQMFLGISRVEEEVLDFDISGEILNFLEVNGYQMVESELVSRLTFVPGGQFGNTRGVMNLLPKPGLAASSGNRDVWDRVNKTFVELCDEVDRESEQFELLVRSCCKVVGCPSPRLRDTAALSYRNNSDDRVWVVPEMDLVCDSRLEPIRNESGLDVVAIEDLVS